ncbi:MAG TPA: DNA cytosine methyltransferase [Leptolyngbyaceae cyanobacterium]
MEAIQLSLFCEIENQNPVKKQKKPKLGRYERIQKELNENGDPYKIFIDVNTPPTATSTYRFVDLFCGAGGITQGLVQAGFQPIASVEINSIASATYKFNFPQCHLF